MSVLTFLICYLDLRSFAKPCCLFFPSCLALYLLLSLCQHETPLCWEKKERNKQKTNHTNQSTSSQTGLLFLCFHVCITDLSFQLVHIHIQLGKRISIQISYIRWVWHTFYFNCSLDLYRLKMSIGI